MSGQLRELAQALRRLARRPALATTVAATLALGIGAATAIFAAAYAALLKPLPYPDPEGLVAVREIAADGRPMRFADPNFLDLRDRTRSFDGLAEYAWGSAAVRAASDARLVQVAWVSGEFFRALRLGPRPGRAFVAEELRPNGPAVAVASEAFWRRELGATPELDTARVWIDGVVHAVVGVLPAGVAFPPAAELWVPREAEEWLPSRTAHNWNVLGRLRDGVSLAQARADATRVARGLAEDHGGDIDMEDVALVPLRQHLSAPARPALLVQLGGAVFLLLATLASAASLLAADALRRRRELAVRAALGAGRSRLRALFLSESLWIAAFGGAGGLLIARWGTAVLRWLEPAHVPRRDEIAVEGAVVLLGCALALGAAAALSWGASIVAGRGALSEWLRQSPRVGGRRAPWTRRPAIVSQVAIAVGLLGGVALVGRSLLHLLAVDPGFRAENVVAMDFYKPRVRGAEAARQVAVAEELIARLGALPGVRAAGVVSDLPLSGGGPDGTYLVLDRQELVRDLDDFRELMRDSTLTGYAEYRVASEGYFAALGIPLLAGRLFDARDVADAPPVALVSRSLAEERWPGGGALGRRLEFGNMDGDLRLLTVVGIVGDVRQDGLDEPPEPTVYVGHRQRPQGARHFTFVAAHGGQAAAVRAQARDFARQLAPEIPVRLYAPADLVDAALGPRRLSLLLLGLFAGAALLLALAGVHGTVAHAVAQRTREIGVRLALGARRRDVVGLAVGQGMRPVAAGVVIGLAGALAGARWLQGLLYAVRPGDPAALAAAAVLAAATALVACYLPARRAARVEPSVALRHE
jgi:predicted permease